MAEKKDLVEDAFLQMKNLEEAVAQNAKGILAATMGQEIKELVKESLSEEDEDETEMVGMSDDETDTEVGSDEMGDMELDMEVGDDEMDGESEMDMTSDMEDDSSMDDDEVIDLTNATDEEILKVFKAMSPDDGIIVKKDEDMVHLEDTNEGSEYLIDLGEGETDETFWGAFESEMSEGTTEEKMEYSMDEEDSEGVMYEISLDDDEMEEYTEEMEMSMDEEDSEEVMYEISLDDDEMQESMDDEMSEEYDYNKVETKEGKMSVTPKGVGMGKPKFSYKKTTGGFKEDMKQGNPKMGTGKAKFEYKEGKKSETKEASRTLGVGKSFGRDGLPKKKAAPRHLQSENVNQNTNLVKQVEVLREKNEEYRKALNIFRQKLNEVAVFNSNLAYATRLFTEHTTTKQEKINILRRFDGVESIKESKTLYKTLKDELSGKQGNVVTESIEKVIDREPQSGSAINLIESKTYENPQFLRMKDLMSKLTK